MNCPLPHLRARFEQHIERQPDPGCWLWAGARKRDKHPYGVWYVPGISERRTHRIAWRIYHGEIPDGLCVLHRCDVPECVNPRHLFLGTQGDNGADRNVKGRTRWNPDCRGEKNGNHRLTAEQVIAIRASREPGTVVGPRFGVSSTMIYYIRKNKNWRVLLEDGRVRAAESEAAA